MKTWLLVPCIGCWSCALDKRDRHSANAPTNDDKISVPHATSDQDCEHFGTPLPDHGSVGPDTEAPTVSTISFDKDSYKAGERLRVFFKATDNLSGVRNINNIELTNQDGHEAIGTVTIGPADLYVGSDGTFCYQQSELSLNAPVGDYYLRRFIVWDYASNEQEYAAQSGESVYAGTAIPVIKINLHY